MQDIIRKASDLFLGAGPAEDPSRGYWLTRVLLLRGLAVIYIIAFISLLGQLQPLLGENGLMPVRPYLDRLTTHHGGAWSAFLEQPTIFYLGCSDTTLMVVAVIGLVLSILLLLGFGNAVQVALLWVIYMSFDNVGQAFFTYGWESILLEFSFLAIFLCPLTDWRLLPARTPPPTVVIWMFRWMLFRIMFGAGMIKMRGDCCWTDLTCMFYHYETQPIPNPMSWFMHNMPPFVHYLSILVNHIVELIVPFLLIGPRRCRLAAGIIFIGFQIILIISGNLSWLNWLTIMVCIACFDDRFLSAAMPSRLLARLKAIAAAPVASRGCLALAGLVGRVAVIGLLSGVVLWLSYYPAVNMVSKRQRMNASFNRLNIVNTYGAFGSVGKVRYELVLQGTADETVTDASKWKEYEFVGKPTDVNRLPPQIAPFQPRVDWEIWFAAMSNYKRHPWLVHMVWKLLHNDDGTLSLLANNPFPDQPPRYIRAELYIYRFTTPDERAETGAWWVRTRVRSYLPPLDVNNESLIAFLSQYDWIPEKEDTR